MINTTRAFQIKEGKTWTTTFTSEGEHALQFLASELAAKYVGKASYIRSIKRRNNYDGTQTYIVTYNPDVGGGKVGRSVYTTDIY